MHGDWFRHGVEQSEEHRSGRLQRRWVPPIRPAPLAPGSEESRLHSEKDVSILLEYRPELSNVAEDAVHILRIGAIVPAGEPVGKPNDRLQAVLPGRREGSPDFIKLLRREIAFLEGLQVDFDQQKGDPGRRNPSIRPRRWLMRRAEATLRVRDSSEGSPGSGFPAMRAAPSIGTTPARGIGRRGCRGSGTVREWSSSVSLPIGSPDYSDRLGLRQRRPRLCSSNRRTGRSGLGLAVPSEVADRAPSLQDRLRRSSVNHSSSKSMSDRSNDRHAGNRNRLAVPERLVACPPNIPSVGCSKSSTCLLPDTDPPISSASSRRGGRGRHPNRGRR